jgi:hypothetical protein
MTAVKDRVWMGIFIATAAGVFLLKAPSRQSELTTERHSAVFVLVLEEDSPRQSS